MLQTLQDIVIFQPVDYVLFIGLLTLSIILILWQLDLRKAHSKLTINEMLDEREVSKSSCLSSSLVSQEMYEYAKQLDVFLLETQFYRRSDLSLDALSKETSVPKHYYSQLFSVYFSKNFYQLIAEYRIAYAVKVLNEGRNITIESLAYECGYNSTSSFNKYFKEKTGLTPSGYRNMVSV